VCGHLAVWLFSQTYSAILGYSPSTFTNTLSPSLYSCCVGAVALTSLSVNISHTSQSPPNSSLKCEFFNACNFSPGNVPYRALIFPCKGFYSPHLRCLELGNCYRCHAFNLATSSAVSEIVHLVYCISCNLFANVHFGHV